MLQFFCFILDRKGSTSSMQSVVDDREAELQEENEKQRQIIEKLKEDRTHYRLIADELRYLIICFYHF